MDQHKNNLSVDSVHMLSKISDGNTVVGVNRRIIQYLIENKKNISYHYDAPCGKLEFVNSLKLFYNDINSYGVDLYEDLSESGKNFRNTDISDWSQVQNLKFDLITCISGVMVFDNVSNFVKASANALENNGLLVITNDNILTIRDRLNFLFFGKVKRFSMFYKCKEGIWNVILPQAIHKMFMENNLKVEKIIYTGLIAEDILWIPLALVFFPLQFTYMIFIKSNLTIKERLSLFPFSSLFYRHYIFIGKRIV